MSSRVFDVLVGICNRGWVSKRFFLRFLPYFNENIAEVKWKSCKFHLWQLSKTDRHRDAHDWFVWLCTLSDRRDRLEDVLWWQTDRSFDKTDWWTADHPPTVRWCLPWPAMLVREATVRALQTARPERAHVLHAILVLLAGRCPAMEARGSAPIIHVRRTRPSRQHPRHSWAVWDMSGALPTGKSGTERVGKTSKQVIENRFEGKHDETRSNAQDRAMKEVFIRENQVPLKYFPSDRCAKRWLRVHRPALAPTGSIQSLTVQRLNRTTRKLKFIF